MIPIEFFAFMALATVAIFGGIWNLVPQDKMIEKEDRPPILILNHTNPVLGKMLLSVSTVFIIIALSRF